MRCVTCVSLSSPNVFRLGRSCVLFVRVAPVRAFRPVLTPKHRAVKFRGKKIFAYNDAEGSLGVNGLNARAFDEF